MWRDTNHIDVGKRLVSIDDVMNRWFDGFDDDVMVRWFRWITDDDVRLIST